MSNVNESVERHAAHAVISPSSIARTSACPGSLKINQEAGPQETPYTAEGTRAHMVAEFFAREALGLPNAVELIDGKEVPMTFESIPDKTRDMILFGRDYANFACMIRTRMEETSITPIECDCERKVYCEPYIPECWGTSDLLMIGSDRISIADYKYGANKVEVANNSQLKAYALGAYLGVQNTDPEKAKHIKKVETYIFQPRAMVQNAAGKTEKGYFDRWEYTIDELFSWAEMIKPEIQKALDGVDERMGGDHCIFCAAKGSCALSINFKKDYNAAADLASDKEEAKQYTAPKPENPALDIPLYTL